MSDNTISVSTIVSDGFSFAAGRFREIVRVTWFPLVVGATAMAAWAYFTMKPFLLAYIEMLQSMSGDMSGEAIEANQAEMLAVMEQMGGGQFTAAYLVLMILSFLTYAVPTVAYCRMILEEFHPTGFLYFRLGMREISVTLVYIVVLIAAYFAMIIAVIVAGIVFMMLGGLVGAIGGGEIDPGASMALGILMIFAMVAIFYVMAIVFAKFGMALPIASTTKGLGLGRAWILSEGHTIVLANGFFATWFLLLIIILLANFAAAIVFVPLMMLATSLGSIILPVALGAVFYVGTYVLINSLMMSVSVGMFAGTYKRLAGTTNNAGEIN